MDSEVKMMPTYDNVLSPSYRGLPEEKTYLFENLTNSIYKILCIFSRSIQPCNFVFGFRLEQTGFN